MTDTAALVAAAVRQRLATTERRPFVLGICGAQGSGKSTLAAALERTFNAAGTAAATLSLDDLYKTRAARQRMASEVHPLFATRGVPGTHDLHFAFELLQALDHGRAGRLPRFDKARDDRGPESQWDGVSAGTQLLMLEGWFVGALPQMTEALAMPVNALERDEDWDGMWRRFANRALAGDYQRLFARIDFLVFLAAPDFEVVERWRAEQESRLRAITGGGMDDTQIGRFVQHFERITRHVSATMPEQADVVVRLDAKRRLLWISARSE